MENQNEGRIGAEEGISSVISAENRIKGSKTPQLKEFRLREQGKKKLRRRTGGALLDRTY
jgi:hypothetical protein